MIKYILTLSLLLFFTGCSIKNTKYAIIEDNKHDGVINDSGYVVVKPKYKHIFNFDGHDGEFDHIHTLNLHWIHNKANEAYAIVQSQNGKFGIIGQKGKLLLKPKYDSITYFFNGFARIESGGKFGLIDRKFNIVLKPIYDEVQEFIGDIAILKHSDKYGCINKKMELKIKPTYDRIYFQQENHLRTKIKNKWGYLDNKCNILAKPIYNYAYNFSNGIAKVLIDDKVGYLKTDGKLLSKPRFTQKSGSF